MRSLYGTTKLASELLIEEYRHAYNLNAIINRCGVITGSWQMGKVDQGVFTLSMAAHYFQKSLSYIGYGGTGKQVRDLPTDNYPMMSDQTILAYITAYKSSTAVKSCMESIFAQSYPVKAVFIFDNSPDALLPNNDRSIIVHCPDNLGIGAGIQKAYQYAVEQDYDFLWTFDQDSYPESNCLERLLSNYSQLSQNDKVGIIAPTALDLRNNHIVEGAVFCQDHFIGYPDKHESKIYECDAPITSGALISLAAAKKIDGSGNKLFSADLFIDGVDWDYGLKFKKQGFHNFVVPDAILKHNFGTPKTVNFFNKELIFQQYSALRHYYIARNHTYLETRNAQGIYQFTSVLRRIKYAVYTSIKITLYDSGGKKRKIFACWWGTYHGFVGKLGKLWRESYMK